MNEYPKGFTDLLSSIKAKRPRTVINHILKYGRITSQDLKDIYGYNHPPRAIRDVREYGIPIITERVIGSDGRKIASYKFGNPVNINNSLAKIAGRTVLSKILKEELITKFGSKCQIYNENIKPSLLQIDHRIPYEIAGENDNSNDTYMLLSPSANKAKSWTCEHCNNWTEKDVDFCVKCFWAHPENYEHVAGTYEKIITILFTGNEVDDYNKLIELAGPDSAQYLIKKLIHDYIK